MKVKNQKESKRDEFRKHKESRHPAYIYAKIGNDYKFIGLTHSPITDNIRNIRLERNPNPNDKEIAYFRPKAEKDKVNKFKKKEKEWSLSKRDRDMISKYKKWQQKKSDATRTYCTGCDYRTPKLNSFFSQRSVDIMYYVHPCVNYLQRIDASLWLIHNI